MSDKKYIKNFIFNENEYEKEAILKIFDLCEEIMNLLL
jgi:hypothetical protein